METRSSILEKILSKIKYRNIMISISHSNYKLELGGTEKVLCEEQAILFKNGISYIHFFPKVYGIASLLDGYDQYFGMTIDGKFIAYFNVNQLRAILYVLEKLNVNILGVNIHHTLGIAIRELDKLINNISDNIKFFLHDYYSACPQVNFLKNDQIYCGDMPESKCLDCMYGEKRKKYLSEFRGFFNKYDLKFIVPSEIAKEIWLQTYEEFRNKVKVVPHQTFKGVYKKSGVTQDKIKIAYIGIYTFKKGWAIWESVANNIDIEKYELYYMGYSLEKIKNVNNIKVSFQENGRDAMVRALRENNIDIVILWAAWPETYSFTYFESYAAGAFVITSSYSGNIAAEVIKNQNGIVLENADSIYRLLSDNNKVLELLKQNTMHEFPLVLDTNTELLDEIKNLVIEKNEKFSFSNYDLMNILNEL